MAMCTGDRFQLSFAIEDKEKFEGLIFQFSFKYSVNAQMETVRFYGESCALKFCAVYISWNIKQYHPLPSFHHLLERGFMIPR